MLTFSGVKQQHEIIFQKLVQDELSKEQIFGMQNILYNFNLAPKLNLPKI